MLSTFVKNEKYRKLFFTLSFMLSAELAVNPVHAVYLGLGLSYKGRRKYVSFVGEGRANLNFLAYALRSTPVKLCQPGVVVWPRGLSSRKVEAGGSGS